MSVQSFISAAKHLHQDGYYYEALCLVCNAIDSCAFKRYPHEKVTDRYKKFLTDHFLIISAYGFPGVTASNIKIKMNTKIDNLKPDSNGYVNMEQIIYHVIRCGLVHNCEIEKSITFTEHTIIGDWNNDKFTLPKSLILGLIKAVETNYK